jgi:putative colanic acid biosynthesis acetyltransferase WcaF
MSNSKIEKYHDVIPLSDKIKRKIWLLLYFILYRPFSGILFNSWRVLVLKLFGAKIGKGSIIYSSAQILAPWNLEVGEKSCIGPRVILHIDKTVIGSKVTISQGTYLCSGSHDVNYLNTPFISAPIIIKDFAWVAAESFIMMGVTIGEGAVIGARACVFKDVEPWTIIGGNPAKFIKKRNIKE